jgi:hypothetical protein
MRKWFLRYLIEFLCKIHSLLEEDEDAWLIPVHTGDLTDKQGEAYLPGAFFNRP